MAIDSVPGGAAKRALLGWYRGMTAADPLPSPVPLGHAHQPGTLAHCLNRRQQQAESIVIIAITAKRST